MPWPHTGRKEKSTGPLNIADGDTEVNDVSTVEMWSAELLLAQTHYAAVEPNTH